MYSVVELTTAKQIIYLDFLFSFCNCWIGEDLLFFLYCLPWYWTLLVLQFILMMAKLNFQHH